MQSKLGKPEAAEPRKPKHTLANPNKCVIPHAGELATLQAPAGPDLDVTNLPLRWAKRKADIKKPSPLLAPGKEPGVGDGSSDVSTTLNVISSQNEGGVNIIIFAAREQDGNHRSALEDATINPGDGRSATMDTAPVGIKDDTASLDTATSTMLPVARCRCRCCTSSTRRAMPSRLLSNLDLMVSPSLENDAKANIETENTSLKHYKSLLNT